MGNGAMEEGRTIAKIKLDDELGEGVLGCEHGNEARVTYGPDHPAATKEQARERLIEAHQQHFTCGCAVKVRSA